METVVFDNKDRDRYNNFLLDSKCKDILQSWEWGEVKSKFNWRAERLGFFKESRLVGLAQVLERKLPLGFSLFYIPRGPVIDWQNHWLVEEAIAALKGYFSRKAKNSRILFLRLEPPVGNNEGLSAIFKDLGFKNYFKTVQPPSTLLIDLTHSEKDLLARFRRTARNLIHRSQKERMTVEALTGSQITSDYLKGFYNLYRSTGKRFSFPLRPYKQFLILKEVMGGSGMMRFYVAKIKGLILAYGIVLLCGEKAFYIWGGTGRHRDYSKFFNYGYIWGILKDLKITGIKTFDFWGLGPEKDFDHPWSGFTLFKTAFDGNRFNYSGAFDLPISGLYPLFKLADKIITPKYRATSS
ncbi:MAG: peptidoglycan bridge formation glycyltransferase FemA/FemB family protein [Parcubacteria group bacterium]|nr:peptidoglycan bridge formation glycyltransferase FemA/FemB family protein [Parcubacteria group bacterium]